MSQPCQKCLIPDYGMLPFIIFDAATKGRDTQVMSWLEKGGDINASDLKYRTLLYLACENNHLDLLKTLLKHPDVHLNQEVNVNGQHVTSIPLGVAISKGHIACVEVLMNSKTSCQIILNKKHINNTLIKLATDQNQWKVIQLIQTKINVLEDDALFYVLHSAVKSNEMDIVRDICKRDYRCFPKAYQNIFKEVYDLNKWEETDIEAVYKRDVLRGSHLPKRVLLSVMRKKDWRKLEILLKMMNSSVEINIDLAEAVCEREVEVVSELLTQEKLQNEVMNGTLLVASIGGTHEVIVNMLFDQKHEYPGDVLKESLILACFYGRIEVLPPLLQKESFSYTTLDQAKNVSSSSCESLERLIKRALERAAQNLLPLEKDRAKVTEEN